ncbi:MOSC domain-containing protein [Janthinobacterium sp. 17J80-10]|uniref:MOSC domain-containing protein n=1 Tax=Janthinobacterium sp. 17J80-10 TaxID=2497863 RepID=UPI001005794F|nr:MOSC domain-containing protein [Janthinobacterium sp. 17J80-10]QAU33141.1 MOSC domain-containing protein [Janthinobacterium sp. 17J80-10]
MKILSVNLAQVGRLQVEQHGTLHRITSAINKMPVSGMVEVGRLGLAGDEQADLSVHGGLDKAVYAYPVEHYAFWEQQRAVALKRSAPLPPGSMGENLTLEGLLEEDLWVGDRLTIGSSVFMVTEPRRPCFKFAAKMGFSHAVKMMVQSGFTGFYLRVVQTGALQSGDTVHLAPGPRVATLAQINRQRYQGRQRDLF